MDREELANFHHQAERRNGACTGLMAVKKADGTILSAPNKVEAEITFYFEALFQGRHVTSNGPGGPVDSGQTFVPDEAQISYLLEGLPTLQSEDREALERPFKLGEVEATVEASSSSKSPGPDGL